MDLLKTTIRLSIVAIILALAPAIYADPVVITSGTIVYSNVGSSTFTLAGAGFSTNGSTTTLNSSVSLLAGGFINFGATGSTGGSIDTQDAELFPFAPIIVGGTAFSPASSLLQLGFSGQSFVAPLTPSSGFVVIAPFNLTLGLIEGYPGILGQGVALFSAPLSGSGTTTLTYFLTPGGQFQLQSQVFVFGQTVSSVSVHSVPEPASVLLFGAGLAGLLRMRRKRRG